VWIVVASTCSRSAPESAGLTSDLSLQQAERLASSVTLSGKLSPPRSWRLAWKRKPWLRHLSGATCEPSTAGRGVELWIASLAATRANRSASPVSDVGRTIRGTFGRRSLESLRRLNPHSVSSRTSEGTYRSGSTLFGTSFKEWGSELRLDFSRRQKLARRIGGSGCSSWPTATSGDAKASGAMGCDTTNRNAGTTLTDATERMSAWASPVVSDAHRSGPLTEKQLNRDRGSPRQLSADVATWSTPRTSDTNGAGAHGTGGVDLRTQVGSWPTPMAQDGEEAGSVNANMVSLGRAAKEWPTPGANDHKGSAKDGQRRGQLDEATEQKWQTPTGSMIGSRKQVGATERENLLPEQASQWPTPASTMTAGEDLRSTWTPGEKPTREDGKALQTALTTCSQIWSRSSHPDLEAAPSGSESCEPAPTSRPRLNPVFVEWMMGWPHGWTDFGRVETGSSLWRRRMRSCLCGLVWRSEMAERK
jgi:hypothetical protein